MSKTESPLSWAFEHKQPKHPKYRSMAHPIFAIIFGTLFFMVGVLIVEKIFETLAHEKAIESPMPAGADAISVFLLIYLVLMIGTRYMQNGAIALYEFLWACNLCMLLVCYGIFKRDRHLIGGAVITISTDQVLW